MKFFREHIRDLLVGKKMMRIMKIMRVRMEVIN